MAGRRGLSANRASLAILAYFALAICGGWFLRGQPAIAEWLGRMPTPVLLSSQALLFCTGIPLSAVGDLLLLKRMGLSYLLVWPTFVGLVSGLQVSFFRSRLLLPWSTPLAARLKRHQQGWPQRSRHGAALVLFIRSAPVLPFLAGSLVIALLRDVSLRWVLLLSVIGAYIYYGYFGLGFLLGSSWRI